jgi:hypothetical protein
MLLIRRNRRLLVHLLSLALLFAQLGVAVHASAHLKADPHGIPTSVHICGECLSFSPLQNMVGGALTVVLPVKAVLDRALESRGISLAPARPFNAFRSRAPPTLL